MTEEVLEVKRAPAWFFGFINHTGMLFVSFILILILTRGRISSYGLRITENLRLKETTTVGLIAGFIIAGSALL
ncbi:hypothetical protein AMJ44_12685 [candidate division WOR-1 bacterium DG_54_3]|uniref:Uncharacterized protein n=1 Tax=candidate division WOR-1 bacterium DG_54_3 TaxID=1703775 RepID=A0A0S7XQA6_UNCSA|nr:MAG: hypothetical protein AMJ44_12685 [candidate division WOR-1 bacterium DG_54_3]